MENRKNRPMWVLFLVLLIVLLVGLTCEFALKYISYLTVSHPADPPFIMTNRLLRGFGEETAPVWAVPALLLYWIPWMPRQMILYALRWLPYLVVFLLPAFAALMRRKQILLIPCAVGAGFVSVGLVLVRLLARQPMVNVYAAIPFGIECVLLILACIALGAKKRGFAITVGVLFVLFALLSPAASALIGGLPTTGRLPAGYPVGSYVWIQLRRLPLSAAASQWPIFKTFAFVMYALLLFGGAKRFRNGA